jgi:hypothetical protein
LKVTIKAEEVYQRRKEGKGYGTWPAGPREVDKEGVGSWGEFDCEDGILFMMMMDRVCHSLLAIARVYRSILGRPHQLSTTQSYGDDHGFSIYLMLSSDTAAYMRLNSSSKEI